MAERFNYEPVKTDYLEIELRSHNPIRRWFHKQRYDTLNRWLEKEFNKGRLIADLGCSVCAWNSKKYPVIGIDINREMLKQAKKNGRLIKYRVADIGDTGLPNNSVDIVILSEVLEHLYNYRAVLSEAHKILKKGGKLFISVPYDTNFSLWKPFFNIYCMYRGSILGENFYKLGGDMLFTSLLKALKRHYCLLGLRLSGNSITGDLQFIHLHKKVNGL